MKTSDAIVVAALIKVKNREISSLPDDSEINHSFSTDFEEKMNKLILSIDKNKLNVSVFRNTFVKAAVITLALCISVFSLVMTSPQARAAFTNAVTEFYENHIKFHFISGDVTSDDFIRYENVYAEYTPQGFILKEQYNEYEAVGCKYENAKENRTYDIYISLNDGLAVHTDDNPNNVEKISVAGKEAYLISDENEGIPYSTLIITGNKITVTVYGQLDKEEIIKVGESLKEK